MKKGVKYIPLTASRSGVLEELWFRIGSREASRALGFSSSFGLRNLVHTAKTVQQPVMRAAIKELRKARAENRFHVVRPKIGARTKRSWAIKDGKKICGGPFHSEGVWLPVERFYPVKTGYGYYCSYCKECASYINKQRRDRLIAERGGASLIPVSKVRPHYLRLLSICENDPRKAAAFSESSVHSYRMVVAGEQTHVRRENVKKIFLALLKYERSRAA